MFIRTNFYINSTENIVNNTETFATGSFLEKNNVHVAAETEVSKFIVFLQNAIG